MSSAFNYFIDVYKLTEPIHIDIPNGHIMVVEKAGKVPMGPGLVSKNVSYIPNLVAI